MQLFNYYFKMKSTKNYLIDGVYFSTLIVFFSALFYLYMGKEATKTFSLLEMSKGGLTNGVNIELIMIPILPTLIIYPMISILFPQIFFVKKPIMLINLQLFFYYLLYLLAFIVAIILMGTIVLNKMTYELNVIYLLSLLLALLANFIFFKLIYLIYSITTNKVVTLILVYLFCYIDLALNKVNIFFFFSHGILGTKENQNIAQFTENVLFLILLFIILEVSQRWILSEKNYIKKAK
ncbi:hypothetical protein ACWOFR_06110 [Carnobacterium gallinarum]|uniref:hypothetical protein n=1 Tax=Carnobacterium gallinarum TaxID=2749 RepID=UPI000553600C|nr:hypothetical protein [Carnobacterium gallinarum]